MSVNYYLALAGAGCALAMALGVALWSRRAVARWALAGGLLFTALSTFASGLSLRDPTTEGMVRWHYLSQLAAALTPALWLVFSLSYSRGDRQAELRRWSPAWLGSLLIPPALIAGFRPNFVIAVRYTEETGDWMFRLGWAGMASQIIVLVTCVLVLMNLERTFRASVGTIRWRIKFAILGVGVIVLARIYTSSQALLFRGMDPLLESVNAVAILVAGVLLLRAVFRKGQYETTVYPSRAVIQNSLTVILAGIYLLVLAAFAQFTTFIGGDAAFALKALVVLVALVILAVLLQSDRLRVALRRFVSRHFQRPLYDYEATWKKFTEATASRVEQADLSRSLVTLIAEMFQALSVTLWLIDDKKERFVLSGSTSISQERLRGSEPDLSESLDVQQALKESGRPADFEQVDKTWAVALRRWHPSEFANGGNRVAVPLLCRGELLGVLIIGDRVSGMRFSLEDFDMLKCIGDHAAASLLNVQLSHKLLESKELEAFQTMATFFVHDLKNAASTLKLMLQNLPVHYNDPEFRADALRGIGKTVAHINHLTSRLSHLRHELKINLAEINLTDLVNEATAELEKVPGPQLIKTLPAETRVLADRDQLGKVVTNLVLNAREAMTEKGEVRISSSRQNGWAILSVADDGCGMSADFLAKSLFRPFQTTKKNGLGIGMFQSKMIVEAHGGKIAVTSEPGKGTTFHVYLRSASPS